MLGGNVLASWPKIKCYTLTQEGFTHADALPNLLLISNMYK